MLRHYLISACRGLNRDRLHAAVSVVGLALGLACFAGAALFASYVRDADAHFPGAERIYVMFQRTAVQSMGLALPFMTNASPLLAERLRTEFPQLEAVVRSRWSERTAVAVEGQDGTPAYRRVRYAEPAFLDVFALPFRSGSAADSARHARSAILTAQAANALFGAADPLGRTLRLDETEGVPVTAVIDAIPEPSHLGGSVAAEGFEILVLTGVPEDIADPNAYGGDPRWQWRFGNVMTYLLFPADGSLTPQALNARLPDFVRRNVITDGADIAFEARPVGALVAEGIDDLLWGTFGLAVTDILLLLGALVLAAACLNYMSLAIARAASRAGEVGLRKAIGAGRKQIAAQYLWEAVLVTAAAVTLALVALEVVFRAIVLRSGHDLPGPGSAGAGFAAFAVLLTFGVALASGCYPALLLARTEPVVAMRAGAVRAGPHALRTLLSGLQFAVASFLVIAVIVMAVQNRALQRAALAIGPDLLVVLTTRPRDAQVDPELLRTRLLESPLVEVVTGANVAPWEPAAGGTGFSRTPDDAASYVFMQAQAVSYDYFETLGTPMLAGRTFARDHADIVGPDAPPPRNVVIDRLAAEQFGWRDPADALGETIYSTSADPTRRNALTIVGVVEHAPPRLLGWGSRAFVYMPDPEGITFPIVKLSRRDVPAALAHVDAVWRELAPAAPLAREFVDERFARGFRLFDYLGRAFTALAGIALAIACMGIFALASYVTARRRREIGVRKVLGATSKQILLLLLGGFLRPVLIANLAVWPLAYLAARTYLGLFMHAASLTPLPSVLGLAVTLAITCVVVLRQALGASATKPARLLRYE